MNNNRLTFAAVLICLGLGSAEAHAAGFYITGASIGTPIPVGVPDEVGYGTTLGPSQYSIRITTTDGDTYSIAGTVLLGYGAAGSMFQVDMTATYTGSLTGSPASAGTDSFTVDVYDGIFDPGPGSWAGSYTNGSGNTVGWPTLGSGSSFSENLYWDGMAVGEVGPFSTPGYSYQSVTKTLDFGATNDAAANLNGDYRFNFTFGAGSATGAFDTFATPVPSSTLSDVGPTTPEPRATLPILGLMAIGVVLMRVRSGRSLGGEQL